MWRRKVSAATTTPASETIADRWPLPSETATYGARAGPHTARGTARASCVRRWAECATPEPKANSSGAVGRADKGFYASVFVAVCRKMMVHFSIASLQRRSLRDLIVSVAKDNWTPMPCEMEGGTAGTEISFTFFANEREGVPVGLIEHRVKPTRCSPPTVVKRASPPGKATGRNWRPTIAATLRRRMSQATSSAAWGSMIFPRYAFPPMPRDRAR